MSIVSPSDFQKQFSTPNGTPLQVTVMDDLPPGALLIFDLYVVAIADEPFPRRSKTWHSEFKTGREVDGGQAVIIGSAENVVGPQGRPNTAAWTISAPSISGTAVLVATLTGDGSVPVNWTVYGQLIVVVP